MKVVEFLDGLGSCELNGVVAEGTEGIVDLELGAMGADEVA